MTVKRRTTTGGKTAEYHFRFMVNGKDYHGVCTGCTTKEAAEAFERQQREIVMDAARAKSARQFAAMRMNELAGGENILIADAYEMALKQPRKKQPDALSIARKRARWNDFAAFMKANYPDIVTLGNVRKQHAGEYIAHVRSKGRFQKIVSYQRDGKTIKTKAPEAISGKTANDYLMVCREVFNLMRGAAGLLENPFGDIPAMEKNTEAREAFSESELELIRDNLNDFTRPLFYIAIATALREGDICTLLWKEVDLISGVIRREAMRKTGHPVEIPIMPPLRAYLENLRDLRNDNGDYAAYLLPDHAKMYLENPSGVSYRIKTFLEGIGIRTTRKISGRRSVSIKDLHSCRHTFCYYAGLYGLPMNIVQSIVGHMTPEMTRHYSAHATIRDKRAKMRALPDLLGIGGDSARQDADARAELRRLADSLPLHLVNEILQRYRSGRDPGA